MKLVSFDVTLKFGNDVPFDVTMSPQEVFALLSMPSLCDSVRHMIPHFLACEADGLPSVPEPENKD